MQPLSQSHYMNQDQVPSHIEYSSSLRKEKKVLRMDYKRVLCKDSLPSVKERAASTTDSLPFLLAPSVNTAAISQAGVTLTPELIASLASLLPASAKPSGYETSQLPLGSSSTRPLLPRSSELDTGLLPQGWKHDCPGTEQTGHALHQVENQFNPQLQTFATSLNTSSNAPVGVTGNSQVQDPAFHLPQQAAVSSRTLSTFGIPSQSGNLVGFPQFNQEHMYEVPQNPQNGFGMARGADSLHSYGPLLISKVRNLQSAPSGANQGTSEVEIDKSHRYQSTLQLAANLLLLQVQQQQLKQQQQETSTQAGQDSENH
ncbi:RNA binding protein [Actinidia rufa]|uniref:RNA binding protein n=1 Tax=Actinidia rufa TaxID=165716 RepID=A0A7J0F3G9_9ERIC|nr:RNA binding protein [Actinidia rufa]